MLYGIIAMFGWGISNFFAGRFTKSIGFLPALFWNTTGIIIWLILIIMTGRHPIEIPSAKIAGFLTISGSLFFLAGLAFYKGLQVGKISLLSPIANSWPMLIAIVSIINYPSSFSLLKTIGMLLVVFGVLASSIKYAKKNISISDPGIPYAFLALVGWFGAFYIYGITITTTAWVWMNILFLFISACFVAIYAPFTRQALTWHINRRTCVYFILGTIPATLAFYFYSLGMRSVYSSTTAIVTNLNPIITVLIALYILHEKLSKLQIVGIATVIIGLMFIN
mgnify:CR=1 FL=1